MSEPTFKIFSYNTSVNPRRMDGLMVACGATGMTGATGTHFQNQDGPLIDTSSLCYKEHILKQFNNTFVDYNGPGNTK